MFGDIRALVMEWRWEEAWNCLHEIEDDNEKRIAIQYLLDHDKQMRTKFDTEKFGPIAEIGSVKKVATFNASPGLKRLELCITLTLALEHTTLFQGQLSAETGSRILFHREVQVKYIPVFHNGDNTPWDQKGTRYVSHAGAESCIYHKLTFRVEKPAVINVFFAIDEMQPLTEEISPVHRWWCDGVSSHLFSKS